MATSKTNGDETPETSTSKPNVITVTDINQLSRQTFDVIIEYEYDGAVDELHIPMQTLTFSEWRECERLVPNKPVPPQIGTKSGPQYITNEPAYIEAMNQWLDKVGMVRLIKALRVGGIQGNTLEEQIDFVMTTFDTQVVNTLSTVLRRKHSITEARIESRANGFQRD